ncbi:MAG: hypothetical protein J5516_09245 [Bacteroidales bacterium]|nr:hypothetical protein [Bacteroidales bacterium]
MSKKLFFRFLLPLLLLVALIYAWVCFGSKATNPHNYPSIGKIPVPYGYERVNRYL